MKRLADRGIGAGEKVVVNTDRWKRPPLPPPLILKALTFIFVLVLRRGKLVGVLISTLRLIIGFLRY